MDPTCTYYRIFQSFTQKDFGRGSMFMRRPSCRKLEDRKCPHCHCCHRQWSLVTWLVGCSGDLFASLLGPAHRHFACTQVIQSQLLRLGDCPCCPCFHQQRPMFLTGSVQACDWRHIKKSCPEMRSPDSGLTARTLVYKTLRIS